MRDAHWVRFLGQDTDFHLGFERVARLWRYPVVMAGRRRTARGRYEVRFEILAEPPYHTAPAGALVERYAAALERSIRAHPADWLWSHRRWRSVKPFYR